MNIKTKYIKAILILLVTATSAAQAGGISVDAGLTPGKDRWMLRTQYRFMEMENSMMTMQDHMVPLVIAYGVSSNFTLMVRTMYVNRIVKMNNKIQTTGINDAYVLLKFKAYRENTEKYVFGIAPYVASNIPIGNPKISGRTWNPDLGLSVSFRPRPWSLDFTSSYTFMDALNKTESEERNNLNLNIAFSSTIPLGNSDIALSPVFEVSYNKELDANANEGSKQDQLFLSPGFMFIKSSIILEILYQNPIYQQSNESLMKSKSRFLLGLRYMF